MTKRKETILTPGEKIAQQILDNYDLKNTQDVQDALKQVFGPIFEAILKGEIQNHLGYEKNGHTGESTNTRNGYSKKTLKTSLGEVPISVPRDRQGQFETQIVKKYQRNVSSIEGKVLAMYARGMSQRDIAATIEDMYGFQLSHEQISNITDCVMEEVDRWRTRPLKPFYPFSFVYCIYVSMRTERCIVHLIRNSIRYIPRKEWSSFTKQLKSMYGAVNMEEARRAFEKLKKDWQEYPGAIAVWENNFQHVEQLFHYGSAVRKALYTTNAIESVNANFRKVTKKGSFPNEDAIFKIFYLRIQELYKKWTSHRLANWAMIRNQMLIDERLGPLMEKYDKDF